MDMPLLQDIPSSGITDEALLRFDNENPGIFDDCNFFWLCYLLSCYKAQGLMSEEEVNQTQVDFKHACSRLATLKNLSQTTSPAA